MAQSSSRKRKPNPFGESHSPPKKKRNQPTAATDESLLSNTQAIVADEVPFVLECPARKPAKKGRKQEIKNDVFGPKEEDGGFPALKIKYTIRPGRVWTELKTYRNFSIQNQKFSTGSLVYINKHTPPPEPPDPDASELEILAFDKKNHWVGQVLEVKAADPSEVWLRVFWLYWPEELPRGRRKYHGNQELIMSNHMEVVDAKTVTGSADISHWDEEIEDEEVDHRFWRQFYNIQLQGTKSGGLSAIRRHCICDEYYNPDQTMLKCPNPKCGIWNHQECLEDAILEQTYERLVGDQDPLKAKVKSPSASTMAQLKSDKKTGSRESNGRAPKGRLAKIWPFKHSAKKSQPWKGLLKAEISVGQRGASGAAVTITDERAQDPEVWTEGIQCLKCRTSID